ncbi:MAG: hypothetical protein H7839_15885 [Magnetococcus sp. YQC-5]
MMTKHKPVGKRRTGSTGIRLGRFVNEANLIAAIRTVRTLSLAEKTARIDQLSKSQPHLLASVLVHAQWSAPMEYIEVLLQILLVTQQIFRKAGVEIDEIQPEDQELHLSRLVEQINLGGEAGDQQEQAAQKQINDHPEPILFSFAMAELLQAGIGNVEDDAQKLILLAGLNLVTCFAHAAHAKKNQAGGLIVPFTLQGV